MAPKDVHNSSPPNLWMLLYAAKGNFADVIPLRILRWENYTGLSGWIQGNHKSPYQRDLEGVRGDDNVVRKAEIRVIHSEDGGRGHKVAGDKRGKGMGFPSHPPGGTIPANTLTSAPWNWFLTCNTPNCKRTNLCRFKPSLWWFVTGATGNWQSAKHYQW